jgi:hypothetical protein
MICASSRVHACLAGHEARGYVQERRGPHRAHTAGAFWGLYGVGDRGGMRVPAWLRGSIVSPHAML